MAGQRADVILANPNGITINGGGYINTNRAMVTTGVPQVDAAGALRGYEVRKGDVRIEGKGINASNLTGFDIVSRAAVINAEIHAKELKVITGQNSYDPATGKVTALPSDGTPPPAVAIDSTALGGMYAGLITLTSTEKGVGVNLDGMVQSTGDLRITADGRLVAGKAAAKGTSDIIAGKDLTIKAGGVAADKARLAAQGKVSITADDVAAKNTSVYAGASLDVRAP